MKNEKGAKGVGEEEHGHRNYPWHLLQPLSANQYLVNIEQGGTENAEEYCKNRQRSDDSLHRTTDIILHFHTDTHLIAGHFYEAPFHGKSKWSCALTHDSARCKC